MPPFNVPNAQLLRKDPEGIPLSANKLFSNDANSSIRNASPNTVNDENKDEPATNQSIKGPKETIHYPIDTNNPAYRARVTFEAFTFGPKKSGISQKLHGSTTSPNKKTQFNTDDINAGKLTPTTSDIDISNPEELNSFLDEDASKFAADAALSDSEKKTKKALDDIVNQATEIFTSGMEYFEADGEPIVDMYFPASVTFADVANYGPADLGTRGGIIEGSVLAGGGALGSMGSAISNELSTLFDFFQIGGQVASDAARLGFSRSLKMVNSATLGILPGQGGVTALNLINRVIVNPNVRALFGGVSLREFTFQFKMIATSQAEATRIQNIIKHFRKNMYPEAFPITVGKGDGAFQANIGFKFPNLFKIRFKFNDAENVKLPQIHLAYLRSVNHTINPTGGGFRHDGQPNEIDLSLQFVEYRTLDQSDVEKGY